MFECPASAPPEKEEPKRGMGRHFLLLVFLGLTFVGFDLLGHFIGDLRVDLLGFINQTVRFRLFALCCLVDRLFGQIVGLLVLGALLVLVSHLSLSAIVAMCCSTHAD